MTWQKAFYDQIADYTFGPDEPEKIKEILESADIGPEEINAFIQPSDVSRRAEWTALHLTILFRKFQSFQYLLSRPDVAVNVLGGGLGSIPPLHLAVDLHPTFKEGNLAWANLLLQHPDIDINQQDPRLQPAFLNDHLLKMCHIKSETVEYVQKFFYSKISYHAERARKLIAHPAIDLNAVDSQGRSVIFYLNRHQSAEFLEIYRQLFNDRRVTLSLRDNLGRTIKDSQDPEEFDNSAMIREAEKNRARGAKRQVSILKHWTVNNKIIDEAVFYTYVLPYAVEDIISPVEEVLDSLDDGRRL